MDRIGPAFPNIRRGLAGKLALSLVLSTLLIFAVFGYINLRSRAGPPKTSSSRARTASPTSSSAAPATR